MDDRTLRGDGPPLQVDNTMLSKFVTCKRSLYWFLRGLDYKSAPPYFTYGRAFGVAANVWHKRNRDKDVKGRLVDAILAAQELWDKECPIEDATNNWPGFKDLFLAYTVNYGANEPWDMTYGEGEKGFQLPLPGAPSGVMFCGSLDAPIMWKPHGLMVREDKTTGAWVNPSYMEQWDFSTQPTGYQWAMQTVAGECAGVYMNVAGKKPRKEKELRFGRYLVQHDEQQLDRWVEETIRAVEELWKEWDGSFETPPWNWDKTGMRNPMNCTGGMGRSPCLYRNICKLGVEPWEIEGYDFEQEFHWREKKWQPWERDGED